MADVQQAPELTRTAQGLRTRQQPVPAFCAPYVPEAQGNLPRHPYVLYVRGTRTSLGDSVLCARVTRTSLLRTARTRRAGQLAPAATRTMLRVPASRGTWQPAVSGWLVITWGDAWGWRVISAG